MPHDLPTPAALMALAGTGPRIPYPSDTIRLLFSCLKCNTRHQTTITMLPYECKAEVQCWTCYAHEEIRITPNDNRIDVYIRWLRHQRRALARAEAFANLRPGFFLCDDCDQPHRDCDHPSNAGRSRDFQGRRNAEGGRLNAAAAREELGRARHNAAAIHCEEGEGEEEDGGEEDVDGQEEDEQEENEQEEDGQEEDGQEEDGQEDEEQENVPQQLEEGYWPAVEDVYGI